MFPLYELAKLVSFGSSGGSANKQKAEIKRCAWQEVGEMSLMALYFTNDYLLLRFCIRGRVPVMRQLPWLPSQPIRDLCFDATGTWLLTVTSHAVLYIIPALSLMNPGAPVNQLWRIDDVTQINPTVRQGSCTPTCLNWWYTLNDQHIAIVGTKEGEVLFIDLISGDVLSEATVPESITGIELVQDDRQSITYALISTKTGTQWKLLLEQKNLELHWIEDREIQNLDYEHLDGRWLPMKTIIYQTEQTVADFIPLKFYQFPKICQLSPQYAKGRHFVALHDTSTQTFQVFGSDLEHSPLYVYKVPAKSNQLLLTDRVLFTTLDEDGSKLVILSNQMSETSLEDNKDFNKDAVIQTFNIPSSEKMIHVFKRSFPFYWHEKREEEVLAKTMSTMTTNNSSYDSARSVKQGASMRQEPLKSPSEYGQLVTSQDSHDSCASTATTLSTHGSSSKNFAISVSAHTVLDGCIIVTENAVYECRPRISPERLFLDIALKSSDSTQTELLGIMLGLDINTLYELAAEHRLAHGNFANAVKLYQLSKCPHIKRVASFAKYGRIKEVMSYLKQVLNNRSLDLNTLEKKQLSDMALYCFVHHVTDKREHDTKAAEETFRDFLLSSFSYDEMTALRLLSEHHLVDLLFELAKARGLMMEALELLVGQGHLNISSSQMTWLLEKGFVTHLARVRNGTFLRCMSSEDFTHFLLSKPQLAMQYMGFLVDNLADQDTDTLLNIAHLFDPSKSVVQGYIRKEMRSARKRTSSSTSIASNNSDVSDHTTSSNDYFPALGDLIQFFLQVVLVLNHKRGDVIFDLEFTKDQSTAEIDFDSGSYRRKSTRALVTQPSPVSCGHSHTAVVRNGDVYTWGNAQHGRLGHGDIAPENTVAPPSRVETLHMLKIQVISVACGGQHTIALTQQGLYGWGNSQYGQVGVGKLHTYSRPMQLDSIQEVQCVAISCGMYHSMALGSDASVYTWGWGVHGQLGHGLVEDCPLPTKLSALEGKMVTKITAGYSHSVVLTAKGEVLSFGCNLFGQLGIGTTTKQTKPVKVTLLTEPVYLISTKYFHSVVVTTNSQVFTWGISPQILRHIAHLARRQKHSQPGHQVIEPDVPSHMVPQLVDTGVIFERIVHVSCGHGHSVIVTKDGEVFTWGKNFDGQLGTGTRQEQSSPTMVVSINDKKVVFLDCGSEYTVGMDTEGTVWSWGRNEFSQLGTAREKHGKHIRLSGHSKKLSPSDSVFPRSVKGLPAISLAIQRQLTYYSHSTRRNSESEYWWSDDCYEDSSGSDFHLPNLATLGPQPYSRSVVNTVIKSLPRFYSPVSYLRQCSDYGEWQLAADVCQQQALYSQAFHFRLSLLSQCKNYIEMPLSEAVSSMMTFYLSKIKEQRYSPTELDNSLREILMEVFAFWECHALDVSLLEELLVKHLELLAYTLSILLFAGHEETANEADTPTSKHGTVPPALLSQFSTQFLLQVSALALEDINSGHPHEEYKSALLGETKVRLEGQEALIPAEKLWLEIVQNLSKDIESRSHITLSAGEVDALMSSSSFVGLTDSYDGEEKPKSVEVVCFTCNHSYTKKMFMETVLQNFVSDLGQTSLPLNQTSLILTQYYKRKDFIPMACPKCVLSAIHSTGEEVYT